MDREDRIAAIDPVDLIGDNYEAVDMRDDFRRDLLTGTRSVVAARRRVPILRWAAGLVAAAAAVVILGLIWQFTNSVTERPGPISLDRRALVSKRVPPPLAQPLPKRDAPAPVKLAAEGAKPEPSPGVKKHLQGTGKAAGADTRYEVSSPHGPPIVALISVQQPVTDGAGKALSAGDRVPAGAAIRTGRGGRVTLVTRKGSEIHLDSNTELVVFRELSGASRRGVPEIPETGKLNASISRGRLYCSNRDKEIARIDTPAGRVRLLGTIVDAAVVRRDTVAVTVVEGKVQLSNAHGDATVNAGSRSVLVAYRPPQRGVRVNTYKETSWYHGRGEAQSDFGDVAFEVGRGENLVTEVWTMKTDGACKHRVRSFIGYGFEPGVWLPGERWLSVELNSLLWTTPDVEKRTASTSAGHPIMRDSAFLLDAATGQTAPMDLPEGYRPVYRVFAPDPALLAFNGWYRPDTDDLSKSESGVWVLDRRTGTITRVLSGEIKTAPAWSPDSKHIAISTGTDYTSDHHLAIIDIATQRIHDLGINGAGACYSPDGKKIAYCADFKRSNAWWSGVPDSGSIFVLDLTAGAKPVRVSPAGRDAFQPRWSPDGTRLLYRDWGGLVCVVTADGADMREVYHATQNERLLTASWAPSGNAIYLMFMPDANGNPHTRLVSADGSRSQNLVDGGSSHVKLSAAVQAQTDAACRAIEEAVFHFAMGKVYSFEAELAARRQCFAAAAGIFSRLVWDYPLSGIGPDDALKYADAAAREAERPDAEVLHDACKERLACLSSVLGLGGQYHRFSALSWSQNDAWRVNWLSSSDEKHVKMLGDCPGTSQSGPTPYVFDNPAPGREPEVGDVIVRCPLHPDNCVIWSERHSRMLNREITRDGRPGASFEVERGIPYRFINIGDGPLTLIHHMLAGTFEVKGTAKLLPTGSIYTNETFELGRLDEGSVVLAIDAAGTVDWGTLSGAELADARDDLEFCRCVARFEAGESVADCAFLNSGNMFQAFDGEPARLVYRGQPGGSCGALGTKLRFELIGKDRIELYQLRPSGRFHVSGTVRVSQTRQVCKNGWIDKNGKVTHTEK